MRAHYLNSRYYQQESLWTNEKDVRISKNVQSLWGKRYRYAPREDQKFGYLTNTLNYDKVPDRVATYRMGV